MVPDLGATDKWKSKLPLLQSICKQVLVSNILEDNATDEQKTYGLDIADFLLMTETPQILTHSAMTLPPTPTQDCLSDVGVADVALSAFVAPSAVFPSLAGSQQHLGRQCYR